ncbi:hypothetical protein N0V82_005387 [Gnomoniopsis sp. IMI 355080]|nr:hypothetical protein N0V82_005387 [Gnomoniopsis sp. IMI 355080]
MKPHKFQPTTQQQHSVFPDRNNQTTSFTNSLDNAPSIWPRDTVDLQTLSPRPINRYTSDPRHHNASQYQYMQARSGLSVSAQAQYGDLVHGHLPQMPVQQPAFVQGGLDQQHAYSIQASQMSQTTALRPATAFHVNSAKESSGQAASGPSDKGQKAAKSIKSSSKRRYTPAELRIITTMMQAKATSEQIGQRLGRNPNSILLKWGRMQGRYADPHAAAKRRRTGKGGQP